MAEGRLLSKLRTMLAEHGWDVSLFVLPRGHYRTDHRADCYRWEANASKDGTPRVLRCWDTVSACVRNGISIDMDSLDANVSALPLRFRVGRIVMYQGTRQRYAVRVERLPTIDGFVMVRFANKRTRVVPVTQVFAASTHGGRRNARGEE